MNSKNQRQKLGRGLSSLLGPQSNYFEASIDELEIEAQEGGVIEELKNEESLVSTQEIESIENKVYQLPTHILSPGKFQPRYYFKEEEINSLAASIREKGILQPILVRKLSQGQYEIIAGERRWRAAQVAGLQNIPVLVKEFNDQEALSVALVENIQREDLSALEEAEGYRKLIEELHYTQEAVSEVIGKSRSHIANTIRLLQLPAQIKNHLLEGKISAGHARALIGIEESLACQLVQEIIEKNLNVRQAELLLKKPKAKEESKKLRQDTGDSETRSIEELIFKCLGLKTQLKAQGNKGTITLTFDTLKQLDDMLERITHLAYKGE
jgi:ParB family chromosome partitioning protein